MVSAWVLGLALLSQAEVAPVGQVVQLSGQVSVLHGHESEEVEVVALKQASMVHVSDKVITQSDGWVRVLMDDGSVIDVAPDSAFSIEVYRRQSPTQVTVRLRAANGRVWAHVKPPDDGEPDFTLITAQAVANVRGETVANMRGTSVVVDVVEADTTILTAVGGHISLYPGYLLGDAQSAEVFSRQAVTVQAMQWPPIVSQVDADTLRSLRSTLTPPSVLDTQSQPERMGRLEARRRGEGVSVARAGLPLQVLPSAQPEIVVPRLNLDPGARTGQVNVTVRLSN